MIIHIRYVLYDSFNLIYELNELLELVISLHIGIHHDFSLRPHKCKLHMWPSYNLL